MAGEEPMSFSGSVDRLAIRPALLMVLALRLRLEWSVVSPYTFLRCRRQKKMAAPTSSATPNSAPITAPAIVPPDVPELLFVSSWERSDCVAAATEVVTGAMVCVTTAPLMVNVLVAADCVTTRDDTRELEEVVVELCV